MNLFMCFFPLLWTGLVINKLEYKYSWKDLVSVSFRGLWIFFPLFLGVFLRQPKTLLEISFLRAYYFYFIDFGFLLYFSLVAYYILIFHLLLKRKESFQNTFLVFMVVLFLLNVFRACYFQSHLTAFMALGQPLWDVMFFTAFAYFLGEYNGTKVFSLTWGKSLLILMSFTLFLPILGILGEYGLGWLSIILSVFVFLGVISTAVLKGTSNRKVML